jgi:hypothetical protein
MTDPPEPPDRRERPELEGPEGLDALPGIARVALNAGWRTAGWALHTSARMPRIMVEVAISPEKAIELAREVIHSLPDISPVASAPGDPGGARAERDEHAAEAADRLARSLRDEGEDLLRRSRDVRLEEPSHPAYERILSELAPDEARVLRLLLLEGPQPSVDVRTGGPIGIVRSRLIAPGLSMIGARAGCRYVERVPSYLNNLFRLGMVWFSRDTLRDPARYQVLEAQPDVLAAIHSVRYAKVVRRSIHLTPFGEDFCRVCLAPEDHPLEDLPEHSTPPSSIDPATRPADHTGDV